MFSADQDLHMFSKNWAVSRLDLRYASRIKARHYFEVFLDSFSASGFQLPETTDSRHTAMVVLA